ncbi:zinc ribbon domain-containing protein [Nocardia sp. CA-135953]|uniref:zinc ribbon domain-containing protein n=1 Tax=Nocardia sp. CA-135953 TaxID=3239978 RepID=UPI003D97B8ED
MDPPGSRATEPIPPGEFTSKPIWKLRNHRLARAVNDAGWSDLARLLRDKQSWRSVTADRWFASSKGCSKCETVNTELTLSDRVFACGYRGDRDHNAAVDLAAWPTIQHEDSP